jgi:hypothetical protein
MCARNTPACTGEDGDQPPTTIEKRTASASLLAQAIMSKLAIIGQCTGGQRICERHGV